MKELVAAMSNVTDTGIVVLDVGSTNVKSTLFDHKLNVICSRSISSNWINDPYLHIEIKPVIDFALQAIGDFDKLLPVDAIIPSSHGSALALLNASGELALPIMAYEADVPAEICVGYDAISPSFDEVFAPVNPGALTLARQLFWQQAQHPQAFETIKTILPLAQYIAYRLSGQAVGEVTALGAQTHLWDPVNRCFSKIAINRGWAEKFAPIVDAWHPLGKLRGPDITGKGITYAGIHDSNANLLRFLGKKRFCLLSTGTWIIAFDPDIPIEDLDPTLDQVSNTSIFGDPVACCRFMGGREFELIADGADPGLANIHSAGRLISERVFALPSFTDSGGPIQGRGGRGKIVGAQLSNPADKASLASLYCAQMTAVALPQLGTTGLVIVDGPFSDNQIYLGVLQQLIRGCKISRAQNEHGTSVGAAMLALMKDNKLPEISEHLLPVDVDPIDGIELYHQEWVSQSTFL